MKDLKVGSQVYYVAYPDYDEGEEFAKIYEGKISQILLPKYADGRLISFVEKEKIEPSEVSIVSGYIVNTENRKRNLDEEYVFDKKEEAVKYITNYFKFQIRVLNSKINEYENKSRDVITIECDCGCQILKIINVDNECYSMEPYRDLSHEKISNKNTRKIRNFNLYTSDLIKLRETIQQKVISNNNNDEDDVLYRIKYNNEILKLVYDNVNVYFLEFNTIKRNMKEENIFGLILTREQVIDLYEDLKEI